MSLDEQQKIFVSSTHGKNYINGIEQQINAFYPSGYTGEKFNYKFYLDWRILLTYEQMFGNLPDKSSYQLLLESFTWDMLDSMTRRDNAWITKANLAVEKTYIDYDIGNNQSGVFGIIGDWFENILPENLFGSLPIIGTLAIVALVLYGINVIKK